VESQLFVITLVDEAYNLLIPPTQDVTCNIDIRRVFQDSDPPADPREIKPQSLTSDHCIGTNTRFVINGGYYRVILGFQREIALVLEDGEHNEGCLFRAMYLLRVLDRFAEELFDAGANSITTNWRSRVLNPLLQRQLRGIYDHDTVAIKKLVGATLEEAATFYLTDDPLDHNAGRRLRRSLLSLWQVRWSLGQFRNGQHYRAVAKDYHRSNNSTKKLIQDKDLMKQDEFDRIVLWEFEGSVIVAEGIFAYYEDLMQEAVSDLYLYGP
jgi:hypothetical protein